MTSFFTLTLPQFVYHCPGCSGESAEARWTSKKSGCVVILGLRYADVSSISKIFEITIRLHCDNEQDSLASLLGESSALPIELCARHAQDSMG
jgi:hypothetical protein